MNHGMTHLTTSRRRWPEPLFRPPFLISALLALALAASTAGCERDTDKSSTEPPDQPPSPPAPSADVLAAAAMDSLRILDIIPKDYPLQLFLTERGRQEVVGFVQQWKAQTLATENGEAAVRKLTNDLIERLQPARHSQNGPLILMLCDLIEVLEPDNPRIQRYRDWAIVHNNRPVITLKGWFQETIEPPGNEERLVPLPPEQVTLAFIDVYLPETGETHSLRVREGEEFFDVRFISIIGNMRGMELRYLPTGDRFQVMRE